MVLVAVQMYRAGIVSPAGVRNAAVAKAAPDDHFTCQSKLPSAGTRASGALVVLVAVQVSVLGLYLPPVFKKLRHHPRPRQSFHCLSRLPCERIAQ